MGEIQIGLWKTFCWYNIFKITAIVFKKYLNTCSPLLINMHYYRWNAIPGCFHSIICLLDFWLKFIDQFLISCDYSPQKSFAIVIVAAEQALTDLYTIVLVTLSKLTSYPSRTDFIEPKLVVDNVVSRTVTNFQQIRHLIDNNSSVG